MEPGKVHYGKRIDRHRSRTSPATLKERLGMAQKASLNRRKYEIPVTLEKPPWEKAK